jgi:hypothetical protein
MYSSIRIGRKQLNLEAPNNAENMSEHKSIHKNYFENLALGRFNYVHIKLNTLP